MNQKYNVYHSVNNQDWNKVKHSVTWEELGEFKVSDLIFTEDTFKQEKIRRMEYPSHGSSKEGQRK